MPNRKRRWIVACCAILLPVVLLLAFTFAKGPGSAGEGKTSFIVEKGTTTRAMATSLQNEGFIRSALLLRFSSLLFFRGRIVAGEYELGRDMSVYQIARKMALGQRKIYTLRVIEGYNLFDVAEETERNGIMDKDAFLSFARRPDFLKRMGIAADSLEGYLAPDTYFYSKETDIEGFIGPIIQRTVKFFEESDIKKRMTELGLTRDEVLCLGSIIEKEARLEGEKPLISAVFHNRLKAGMSLDADPTVIYGRKAFDRTLKKRDLTTYTPYNTYIIKGLPRGPICNPGRSSLLSVLHPAKSSVLYFVSRNDGSHVFSETLDEHNHYVMVYQKSKNRKPQ